MKILYDYAAFVMQSHGGVSRVMSEVIRRELERDGVEARVFAGVHQNQELARLARIRARLPRPVRLVFFGAHSYSGRPWFDSTWMEERGNLSEAELNRALRKCTWGFS